MFLNSLVVALGLATLANATPTSAKLETLTYDIAVVGGGASGAYAAARLQQQGIKVVVIEQNGRLGGHVNTYHDPTSNGTYDYGVQIFSNISVVTNFFRHYDVPLVAVGALGAGTSITVDFDTGAAIPVVQNTTALGQALMGYGAQVAKYPSISTVWDIPSPIPEDLLLPLGDFLTKYSLQSLAYIAYTYQQGLGNILAATTLYVLRFFDLQQVQDIAGSAFLVNGLQNNQALYDRVATELGNTNVLLETQATKIVRSNTSVNIAAKSSCGTEYHITAKKLLIAIPPTIENLSFLDLSISEKSIFAQFNASYYWNSIVLNSGLPPNTTYTNIQPANPLAIPAVPGLYTINATPFPGVVAPFYGSPYDVPAEQIKSEIIATIKRIRKSLNITIETEPVFAEFNTHNPFHVTVSNEAIKGGFYDDLEQLQGLKSTWFTGRAWNKPATSALWNFTEYQILPRILADLRDGVNGV